MENDIGNLIQVFVWRTPKKNHDGEDYGLVNITRKGLQHLKSDMSD
ncbi:MAG: hypothetical protein ABJB85_11680 [Nitrososphaerota archaeon]